MSIYSNKKVIDGVLYNASTAKLIGDFKSQLSRSDFRYYEAALFVGPKSGRFFVSGFGGASTEFGKPVGNNGRTEGYRIIPINKEEAFKWACEHLQESAGFPVVDFDEVVETYFADLVEEA